MNVIITLPRNIWSKIVSGEKLYEMRKSIPAHLNQNTTQVFVCIKGTGLVAGFFELHKVHGPIQKDTLWQDYGQHLGIPKLLFTWYTANASRIYLWQIDSVFLYDEPISLTDTFRYSRPPQNYYYTEEWPYAPFHRIIKRKKSGSVEPLSDLKIR